MDSQNSRIPPLQVDTSYTQKDSSLSLPGTAAFPSRSPASASSRSPGVPSLRVLTSPSSPSFENPPLSPLLQTQSSQKIPNRGNESRKLLAHVLDQLKHRDMPPSMYDGLAYSAEVMDEKGLGSLLGRAVKRKSTPKDSKTRPQADDDDSEDDEERGYTTEATFELMTRLRDLMIISSMQGWQIFDDGQSQDQDVHRSSSGGRFSSPFRRSVNNLTPSGRRSRSPSPAPGARSSSPGLLSQCISVISSVISEDCRFKISSIRLSRPPNALHIVTLEVAQFLLHTHRHNSDVVSQVVYAVIPAFFTFPPEMHVRLLAFFEECVTRNALEELSLIQGAQDIPPVKSLQGPHILRPEQADDPNNTIVSIRVDEAFDDPSPGDNKWTPWSRIGSQLAALRSTNSPFQAPAIYNFASFFAPLLAAILENIDFAHNRIEVLHRLYRLLDAIFTLKLDAHLDVLEIIAYHTPSARRGAACLLTTFWPKAVGHVIVSKSPVLRKFLDLHAGTKLPPSETSYHVHQFVPWYFVEERGQSALDKSDCHACTKPVHGFGLFCPFCISPVHLDCYQYPEGNTVLNYSMGPDENVQRVAYYRFSPILDRRTIAGAGTIQAMHHTFRLVNVFTLCLCLVCRNPLWGCHTQGLQCTSCHRFAHSTCITSNGLPKCGLSKDDASCVLIQPSTLTQSCFEFYKELFMLNEHDIKNAGYEDLSILYSSLSIQLQIMNNGLGMRSIVLSGKDSAQASSQQLPSFELHRLLSWCEHRLSSGTPLTSTALEDYLQENNVTRRNPNMLFEWSNLVYIASAIKTPYNPAGPQSPATEMLSVSPLQIQTDSAILSDPEEDRSPYEVVPLASMRDVLGYEFNIRSDVAAKLLLSHMHHVGLFDRVDLEPKLFVSEALDIYCVFPLPLGLDESTDVETLFASVEACLLDIDLSVNETGFLLLSRRLWPSGLASEYALARLARAIVSWVLSEDKDLATILRDYLAKQRALPGVRSASDPLPWPSQPNGRNPSSSVNNGGDYVASRRALLSRYATPWLSALHHQDSSNYSNMLYDICVELTDDVMDLPTDLFSDDPKHDIKAHSAIFHDKLIRLLSRLFQNSIAFTVTQELYVRWLSSLSASGILHQPIPSLVRFFHREDHTQRWSIADTTVLTAPNGFEFDPWNHILTTAETVGGLTRSLGWLSVLASSGVDIPVPVYFHFAAWVENVRLSLQPCLIFVNAILKSAWLRHSGRQEMQKLIATLHVRLSLDIIESLTNKETRTEAVLFIRQSLATCLLLYGCDRQRLQNVHLINEDDIRDLPHRRRLGRDSQALDPTVVDPALMKVLESYMATNTDDVSCLIAKFLNVFLTDSPSLESYEVDNFILRNGKMLASCAFRFYDIQRHELSTLRTSFLLRVAVVDTQPLHELLEEWFQPNGAWEIRLSAIARLFRIILDVISPAFTVEGRQWRSSITDVFYYYFSSLWADEKEELRLATDIFASNLLPAHFQQISLCWSEFLAKSPIADRVKLVSFLIQLRPHFPTWQMVSWESIIEIIAEDQYDQDGHVDGPLSAHLSMYGLSSKDEEFADRLGAVVDSDMTLLRVSILLLSLDMIAEGIRIDYNDLLRIKQHVARVLGFDDVHAVPATSGHSFFVEFGELKKIPPFAYSCVNHLFALLDGPHPISITDTELQGFVNDRTWPLLVGSPFVDVLLGLLTSGDNLMALPVLTLKALLESLSVVVYKHNFENVYLRHLQPQLKRAVSRVMEIMLQDINYECRQVALSVVQAYIKRSQGSMRSFVHFAIEQVAKLVVSQSHLNHDPLVTQAKAFIENTLTIYSHNGIFVGLIRRPLDRGLFVVLKQVLDANAKEHPTSEKLRDAILLDTLPRAVDTDQSAFQITLNNLHTFVEIVHHQHYSAEMLSLVGQNLTHLVRRTSEWSAEVINPAPLLLIAALLIQHNKAQSRELLSYTDTVLRVALNRLLVDTTTLSRLVQVTATLYKKGPAVNGEPMNSVILVIFEILTDGLRMKARVLPGTVRSMLETVMSTTILGSTTPAMSHLNLFLALGAPGVYFLHNHSWTDVRTDNDFTASLAVAKMVLQTSSQEPRILTQFMEYGAEKSGRSNMTVRAWNMLLLAVLQDPSKSWIATMFSQLGVFSAAHHAALRPYIIRPGAQVPEAAITDINHAYLAIKCWLTLAQMKASQDDSGSTEALIVWNELWPAFESLIQFFEAEFRAGLSPTLAMLTWSTVADLFLFLRHLPSPVVLHTSQQISLLERLKPLGRGEAHTGKLARTIRSMAEKPPEVSYEVMTSQVAKDIIAAEKLRALEANRDAVPERRRAGQYSTDAR